MCENNKGKFVIKKFFKQLFSILRNLLKHIAS